jgi:hypothetical protein
MHYRFYRHTVHLRSLYTDSAVSRHMWRSIAATLCDSIIHNASVQLLSLIHTIQCCVSYTKQRTLQDERRQAEATAAAAACTAAINAIDLETLRLERAAARRAAATTSTATASVRLDDEDREAELAVAAAAAAALWSLRRERAAQCTALAEHTAAAAAAERSARDAWQAVMEAPPPPPRGSVFEEAQGDVTALLPGSRTQLTVSVPARGALRQFCMWACKAAAVRRAEKLCAVMDWHTPLLKLKTGK